MMTSERGEKRGRLALIAAAGDVFVYGGLEAMAGGCARGSGSYGSIAPFVGRPKVAAGKPVQAVARARDVLTADALVCGQKAKRNKPRVRALNLIHWVPRRSEPSCRRRRVALRCTGVGSTGRLPRGVVSPDTDRQRPGRGRSERDSLQELIQRRVAGRHPVLRPRRPQPGSDGRPEEIFPATVFQRWKNGSREQGGTSPTTQWYAGRGRAVEARKRRA
jgi:hypothetical protein